MHRSEWSLPSLTRPRDSLVNDTLGAFVSSPKIP